MLDEQHELTSASIFIASVADVELQQELTLGFVGKRAFLVGLLAQQVLLLSFKSVMGDLIFSSLIPDTNNPVIIADMIAATGR